MPDKEKVIYSIERCVCHVPDACRDCNYDNHEYNECVEKLLLDALKLLKEQEPVEPIHIYGHNLCGCCGTILHETRKKFSWKLTSTKAYYCPNCGKAVKWK